MLLYRLERSGPGRRARLPRSAGRRGGGRLRQRVTCQNIYEAPAGTTPIQTDSGLEYRRFRDRALRRMGVGAALLLGGLLWAGRLLLRLGQWRRGADGRNLPAPGRWSALTAAVCDLADRLVLGAACLTFLMDVVQSALRGEWLLLLAAHTRWIEEPYRVEFKVYAGGEDCGQLDASLALAGGLDGGVVQETTGGRWATASGGV